MDRRKFVKAAGTAAGVFLGSRVIPASVTPMAGERYAIVGRPGEDF